MKKITFDIEPDQGAAGIFAQCALEGYKLIKLERKNRKVTCSYEQTKIKKGSDAWLAKKGMTVADLT